MFNIDLKTELLHLNTLDRILASDRISELDINNYVFETKRLMLDWDNYVPHMRFDCEGMECDRFGLPHTSGAEFSVIVRRLLEREHAMSMRASLKDIAEGYRAKLYDRIHAKRMLIKERIAEIEERMPDEADIVMMHNPYLWEHKPLYKVQELPHDNL